MASYQIQLGEYTLRNKVLDWSFGTVGSFQEGIAGFMVGFPEGNQTSKKGSEKGSK